MFPASANIGGTRLAHVAYRTLATVRSVLITQSSKSGKYPSHDQLAGFASPETQLASDHAQGHTASTAYCCEDLAGRYGSDPAILAVALALPIMVGERRRRSDSAHPAHHALERIQETAGSIYAAVHPRRLDRRAHFRPRGPGWAGTQLELSSPHALEPFYISRSCDIWDRLSHGKAWNLAWGAVSAQLPPCDVENVQMFSCGYFDRPLGFVIEPEFDEPAAVAEANRLAVLLEQNPITLARNQLL
jgi:hypothetical protein